MANGKWQLLRIAARILRDAGLLGESSSSVKLFEKFGGIFKVISTDVRLFRM